MGFLGGLRGGLYWYAIVLIRGRFHGGLAEFSRGLTGVPLRFKVGFGGLRWKLGSLCVRTDGGLEF